MAPSSLTRPASEMAGLLPACRERVSCIWLTGLALSCLQLGQWREGETNSPGGEDSRRVASRQHLVLEAGMLPASLALLLGVGLGVAGGLEGSGRAPPLESQGGSPQPTVLCTCWASGQWSASLISRTGGPSGQVCAPHTRHWSFMVSLGNFRRVSLVAQTLMTLPERQELGRPLEKGTATHCSVLAWRIPWTEEPGGLQSMGL